MIVVKEINNCLESGKEKNMNMKTRSHILQQPAATTHVPARSSQEEYKSRSSRREQEQDFNEENISKFWRKLLSTMVKTKQTARKGTGAPMKRAKFPPKGDTAEDPDKEKEEEEEEEDKPSPAKKPKKSQRPDLIKGAKKRKSTPISREERTLREIREARKGVELCIPRLPFVRYVMC